MPRLADGRMHRPRARECRAPSVAGAILTARQVGSILTFLVLCGSPRHVPQRNARRQELVTIAKMRSSRREAVAKLKPEDIDYKRLDILTHFVTSTGKIEAARRTGANRKQQARVVRAVKRARYLGLLPYVIDDKH